MTEFQSRTFRSEFLKGEHFDSFKADIVSLKKIEPSKLDGLTKYLNKIVLADNKSERQKIFDEIIKERLIENIEEIKSFHRITNFFLEVFTNEETEDDNPEIVIKDLSTKLEIEENELSSVKKLLILVKNEAGHYKKEKRKESSKRGVLPYLKGFNTTVELRGTFNQEFEVGDDINSYRESVKIEETPIPIISVAISLDSGTPDKFYFQASRKHLKWLIGELESALHKSKLLEERFNKKS